MRVVVVGIGNSLRGDDAAGLEAVRAWQEGHPDTALRPEVRVELVESPGVELAGALDGADAVLLVDAVRSGSDPGTLHQLSEDEIVDLDRVPGSMHGWGVSEALRLANALGSHPGPGRVRFLGIEATRMDVGTSLSAPVHRILEGAAAAIDDQIRAFLVC